MADTAFMDDVIFPVHISWGSAGGPDWPADIAEAASGYEERNTSVSTPLRRYDAKYAVRSHDELYEILKLYHAAMGRLRGFRVLDWRDYRSGSPLSALLFFHVHGAATRVSPTDTAFALRRPPWDFDAIGQWADGSESTTHTAWVRGLWSKLEPHLQGRAYVNHLSGDDQAEKVRASFGANYGRLRALKAVYDPGNLFRLNANIAP